LEGSCVALSMRRPYGRDRRRHDCSDRSRRNEALCCQSAAFCIDGKREKESRGNRSSGGHVCVPGVPVSGGEVAFMPSVVTWIVIDVSSCSTIPFTIHQCTFATKRRLKVTYICRRDARVGSAPRCGWHRVDSTAGMLNFVSFPVSTLSSLSCWPVFAGDLHEQTL